MSLAVSEFTTGLRNFRVFYFVGEQANAIRDEKNVQRNVQLNFPPAFSLPNEQCTYPTTEPVKTLA